MVISFALINSCNENEEKYDSLNIEQTESTLYQVQSSRLCYADCIFNDCEVYYCDPGDSPYCRCSWGFAECGCTNNKGGIKSPSIIQQYRLSSYKTFLRENNLNTINASVNELHEAMTNNGVDKYHRELEVYKNKIENLSYSDKMLIINWFYN